MLEMIDCKNLVVLETAGFDAGSMSGSTNAQAIPHLWEFYIYKKKGELLNNDIINFKSRVKNTENKNMIAFLLGLKMCL